MVNSLLNAQRIKDQALDFGFNLVGIIPATPSPTLNYYLAWIQAEMHGGMGYLARPDRQIRRQDLSVIMPDVRSMLLVGVDYRTESIPDEIVNDPSRGRIASYAWGVDYHDILGARLEAFAEWLQTQVHHLNHRVYVDTGAILERSHAQQAGMGFIGKNTMLINPRRGSYFFLGEILLSSEFDAYDEPIAQTMCGSCTRCLTACPTNAFPRPHVLDARRCISYLTIENKGVIPLALRPLMGNWIYGCDVCQEVCPWNRFSVPTHIPDFYPNNIDNIAPSLLDLLTLDDTGFKARFSNSPILRIKRERLVRNVCVAVGNWGDESALEHLLPLLQDDSPLVRAHAVWAVRRIAQDEAPRFLASSHAIESDADVLAEYA
jgi:epoxyqueuosine reductase